MRQLYKIEEFPVCEIQKSVNEIIKQIDYLQDNFNYDTKSAELLNWILGKLNTISKIAKRDVRFDYLFIQSEIDKLYKKDASLTGIHMIINFKNHKKPNRGFLEFNLNKK